MDAQSLFKTKEEIVSFIRRNGPSLPVQIAKQANTSPLFASAFLSELYKEQKILMSHLKVGSSPLYLLQGQENLLERFTQYLENKEQEAFKQLKENIVLKDSELHPAIRVAIREIKDFAIPIKIVINDNPELFWKYSFALESEVQAIVKKVKNPDQEIKKPIDPPKPTLKEIKKPIPPQEPKIKPKTAPKPKAIAKPNSNQITLDFSPVKEEKQISFEKSSELSRSLLKYLKSKDIQIQEILSEKKKEITAIISSSSLFGQQAFYLTAKDKKVIKSQDFIEALKLAHSKKLPALFLAPGSIEKKSLPTYQEWQNLIKFDKLNL